MMETTKITVRQLMILALGITLSACGGSGGSSTPDVNGDVAESTSPSSSNDITSPSVPSPPYAEAVSYSAVALSWAESTDDVAMTGYRIYRNGTEIATVDTPHFLNSDLNAATQYQYAVSAYDAAGNESAISSPLSVTTQAIESGVCGVQTGSVVAIPFNYVTPVEVGKYITLAATSTLVEYAVHSVDDVPNINWSRRYKDYKYGDGGGAVDIWRLNSTPPNGTLYENGSVLNAGDLISDPDDLFYVPNNGYSGNDSFTYCAADPMGQSNIATVTIQVENTDRYPMPYGVPDPGFGIDERPPSDPPNWPSAEQLGFYYIDSASDICSDESDYGYPDLPRCSIPNSGASIAAGGKMVLVPSTQPYVLRDSSWQQIDFEGVSGSPSWLVGSDLGPMKPVITLSPNRAESGTALRITGGHLRISGVVFDGPILDHRGGGGDEVVVRHSEFKNNPSTGGGGTTVGLSTGGSGVLAFNVYAHDNGIVESEELSVERDIHAFVGLDQSGYWILDSRCDENAGDCVQLTNNNTTSDVYVGRLVAHSEGENCVDIKDYNRVVVSESDCWDLRQVRYGNSGGNAQSFYVNDEGIQQNYVYFLNNRSWDTSGSNYATSNIGGRVYFIGNISFASPEGYGFYSGGGEGSRYAYFNTFVDSRVGIYHYGSGAALDRFMFGNAINGVSLYQARLQGATSVIDVMDYNAYSGIGLFASGGSTEVVHSGLSSFTAAVGFEQNSLEGETLGFTAADIYDFTPGSTSSISGVIPSGVVSSLPFLADLSNDLSLIFKDREGIIRDYGSDYDIGALSYQ